MTRLKMKNDYLILKDGRKVRIEWNANALGMFVGLTGIELGQLASMKPSVKLLITLAWCSAIEGEAADGRSMELNEVEFGRLMSMENIVEFNRMLAEQSGEQKKSPPQNPPRVFLRMFR